MSTAAAEQFAVAADFFGKLTRRVGADQWGDPTPCAEWDVRALVNHVTVEQLWAPPLLDGFTIAEVGDQFDGDQLGDDPVSRWDAAVAASKAAFARPGALDGIVHLSYGDDSVLNYCAQMTLDCLVHGWDLAKGIGAGDEMPPDLVEAVYEFALPMGELLTGSGMFGTPVEVPADAGTHVRLLALLGRAN